LTAVEIVDDRDHVKQLLVSSPHKNVRMNLSTWVVSCAGGCCRNPHRVRALYVCSDMYTRSKSQNSKLAHELARKKKGNKPKLLAKKSFKTRSNARSPHKRKRKDLRKSRRDEKESK
jgi:hypothetical protein